MLKHSYTHNAQKVNSSHTITLIFQVLINDNVNREMIQQRNKQEPKTHAKTLDF